MNFLNFDVAAILKLVIDQLTAFDQIVEQLQAQINELSFQISTSTSTEQVISTNLKEVADITITTAKFKKVSDSLMFNRNQKKLHFLLQNFISSFLKMLINFLQTEKR